MGCHIARSTAILCLISIFSWPLSAQKSSINAVIVQVAEGEVFLDGNPLQLAKNSIRIFKTGQTLSTKQGRIELILASSTNLSVGENASFRMANRVPNGEELILEKGSILIEVVQRLTDPVRVRISNSAVEINKPGVYRLDSSSADLRVYSGSALADNGSKQAQVKSERRIRLGADLSQSKFDPKATDALDEWSAHRSFDIFLANPQTNNWKWKGLMPSAYNPYPMGLFENSNYRARFKAQMPPQYARRVGTTMQGKDYLDQIRKETEDRQKKDEEARKQKELDDFWIKVGGNPATHY